MTTLTMAAGYSLSGVANWIKKINAKLVYRREVQQTINELNKLTDYELNDIGMSRCDIYHVAHSSHVDRSKKLSAPANSNLKDWV